MVNTEVARYDAVDAARIRAAMSARAGADNRVILTYVPAEDETDDEAAA
jgi:hypothetical protein